MSAITPQVLARVAEASCLDPSAAALRRAFPEIHFTECSADDIVSRVPPALETDSHELYLVSGASGHCLALTADFAGATGIVVAAKADE